jgi:uncharacterized protein YjiS (DUF1127 family)
MSATHDAAGLRRAAVSMRRVPGLLRRFWDALRQWRRRDRLIIELSSMSDRELMDIGTTRGEIDYIASNRGVDPRGVRSAE